MYRTLISRVSSSSSRILPSVNLHLSSVTLEPKSNHEGQSKEAGTANSNDDVKFDYVRKTGIIQLNKPKALNALTLPMIERIYPKLKVGRIVFCLSTSSIDVLGMGIRWSNGTSDYQEYLRESILCWWRYQRYREDCTDYCRKRRTFFTCV